eukprot:CAMPEP_0194033638 /NCGR_PEP_ID=MMETSP0009_2-20130614/6247_1 /TAXON_ID=210454 /ORGANISM="Grammatophora oceanica, Strain CCMP 410" /LENGTH=450 /DNA_ID=CAMNT_0038674353 /DNA_START=33 /DNA_END=1385 /DNA_ORIENTATION=-
MRPLHQKNPFMMLRLMALALLFLLPATVVTSSSHLASGKRKALSLQDQSSCSDRPSLSALQCLRGGSLPIEKKRQHLHQQAQHLQQQQTVETPSFQTAVSEAAHNDVSAKSASTTSAAISITKLLLSFGFGGVAAIASYQFALKFPFLLTPAAAKATYIPASFSYTLPESIFCDSAWTYLTDYGLGAVMIVLANKIRKSTSMPSSSSSSMPGQQNSNASMRLKHLGSALMVMYAIQFTVAGVLHQFMGSFESRNTLLFRTLWTVVVTMVSASGGVIGAFASELARESGVLSKTRGGASIMQIPNGSFWMGYIAIITGITVSGLISFQRPAADTFVAGTSQAGSTFFLIGIVALMATTMGRRRTTTDDVDVASSDRENQQLTMLDHALCILGFLMNSLLLPGYALALYHTKISVAQLNTTMHSWLCLCYTLQGLSLSKIVKVFGEKERKNE